MSVLLIIYEVNYKQNVDKITLSKVHDKTVDLSDSERIKLFQCQPTIRAQLILKQLVTGIELHK